MDSCKSQHWMFVWLTAILSVIVIWSGLWDRGFPQCFQTVTASTVARPVSQMQKNADPTQRVALFSFQRIDRLHRQWLTDKGVNGKALEQEKKQLQEQKVWMRELTQQNLDRHMLLASRSLQLESYAEFVRTELGEKVAESAEDYVGTPYVWGGTSPRGFDCSGFTQYVLAQNGIQVPRNSYDQFQVGKDVPKNELKPGDLVFFSTYAPGPSHLGIYIGEGKFVHALNQSTGVITSKLDTNYYKVHFIGAKRIQ